MREHANIVALREAVRHYANLETKHWVNDEYVTLMTLDVLPLCSVVTLLARGTRS